MSDVRLGTVEDALDALRAGRPVLVADSPDRENEADVILAAQSATPEWVAWTIRHSSGYLCAPMPAARADALDLLGNLARRLANDVKAEQAPRMLGPHLEGILRGASAGLVVPPPLCEIASEYAVDLAHWTSDPKWLDYVVELHLVTKRLMSAATISALQRSERWVGALNRSQLEYYVGGFSQAMAEFDKDEKARFATLRRILKKR